jgi:adenine-specific DNA-methyltransferase
MIRLLRGDSVLFPDNKQVKIVGLQALSGSILQADGTWEVGGAERQVAVVFGPQYGPVTAEMVEECIPKAGRLGYDDLLIAGFSFDAAATAIITDDVHPRLRLHYSHIRPDVNMDGLLKNMPNSQLFTVSGLPRASATQQVDGEYVVDMEGVDIYDPISNSVIPTGASKVAAWFLDSDYDGAAFCITQAFFPDKSAWDKLSKALTNVVDPDRFAAFSGTSSLPFPAGKHKRAAVKVIDPRGNEVMRVLRLGELNAY